MTTNSPFHRALLRSFCLCFNLAFGTHLLAQTTFTGAVSSDWFTEANWSASYPGPGWDATIAPGVECHIDQPTLLYNLDIQAGATLRIVEGGELYIVGDLHNYGGSFWNEGYIEIQLRLHNHANSWLHNYGVITNQPTGEFANWWVIQNNGVINNHGNSANYALIYNCHGTINGTVPPGNPLEVVNCPAPDACDGVDNDADGTVDEDCGCTNPNSCNYNPYVLLDDGSCAGSIGCIDPAACNYNASASCDDGSCAYPAACDSCTGQTDGTGTVIDGDADDDGICDGNDPCPNHSSDMDWYRLGAPKFSPGEAAFVSLDIHPVTGECYVAFRDDSNGQQLAVMRFAGVTTDRNAWISVGTPGFTGHINYCSLAMHPTTGEPYVAFQDVDNGTGISVLKYDGVDWVNVGTPAFSPGSVDELDLAFHPVTQEPYVIYRDTFNGSNTSVMRFDGSSWVLVGSAGFSGTGCLGQTLAFHPVTHEPYVAFEEESMGSTLSVMRFDGSTWQYVGAQAFSVEMDQHSFGFNPVTNEPCVVYREVALGYKLSAVKFDGTSWSALGTAGFTPDVASYPHMTFDPGTGNPYVVFTDFTQGNTASVMRFDGSGWSYAGAAGISLHTAFYLQLATSPLDGSIHLAYRDYSSGSLTGVTAHKFSCAIQGCLNPNACNYNEAAVIGNSSCTHPTVCGTCSGETDGTGTVVGSGEAPTWQPLPASQLSGTEPAFARDPATGVPYTLFSDPSDGGLAKVYSHNGSDWTPVGTALSVGSASLCDLAFNPVSGMPVAGFKDAGNADYVTVKEFDGSQWNAIGGAEIHPLAVTNMDLTLDPTSGYPVVAINVNNSIDEVFEFDGTQWQNASPGYNPGVGRPSVAVSPVDGTIYLANRQSNYAVVFQELPSSWWNGLASPGSTLGRVDLALHPETNLPYVLFDGLSTTAVMRWYEHGVWHNVGTPGFTSVSVENPQIAFDPITHAPYACFLDASSGYQPAVMKYVNGWAYSGGQHVSTETAARQQLIVDDGFSPAVGYRNTTTGELRFSELLCQIPGCTDPTACNYNTSAELDNGTCAYPGTCESCSGETDGTGTVVDEDADDDGVCDGDEIPGCQDPMACNYNTAATDDDGGCILPTGCDACSGETDGTGTVLNGDTDGDGTCDDVDTDDDNDGILDGADPDPTDPNVCGDSDLDGCDDCAGGSDGYGPLPDADPFNDGVDTDGDGLCDSGDVDDDNDGVADVDDTDPQNPAVCQDLDGDGCDDCAVGTDGFGPLADFDPANDGSDADGDGICDSGEIAGCQDAMACNYNTAATDDDGSCIYAGPCDACSGETDGTGVLIDGDADDDGVCDVDEVVGCQDASACNYLSAATDPDTCIYPDGICETCSGETDGTGVIVDNDADDDGVCDADEVPGCTDSMASNYNPLATDEDGSCLYPGCTYPFACNYDASANQDDGSCEIVSCAGCTDNTANNYDATATIDDGSCTYDPAPPTCPADLNGDGEVGTGDLLEMLAVFGLLCP